MSSIVPLPTNNGQHDSLDGVPLKDGETLYIKWPTGSVQEIVVALDRVYRGGTEDGQGISIECLKAYIKLPVFGAVAKVYLAGFEAQRS